MYGKSSQLNIDHIIHVFDKKDFTHGVPIQFILSLELTQSEDNKRKTGQLLQLVRSYLLALCKQKVYSAIHKQRYYRISRDLELRERKAENE